MQRTVDRTRETLASAFDALADNARRQQHQYSVTIAVLIAIVLFSGLLLAGLATEQHLDYRRSDVSRYAGSVSQLLHNESSFLRRTVLGIRYNLDAPAPEPSRDPGFGAFRRTGTTSLHVDAVRKDYHLLATEATRQGWGAGLPAQYVRLRQIALAAVATQQAFDLDHGAYAVALNEDSAVVISQPEAGAPPLALDPALIPLLRTWLTQALLERSGRSVPAREQQVWVGPLRHPVDDTPVMVLAGAAYAGDTPTMLVAACVPLHAFLADLQRAEDPALLALLNPAGQVIDVSPQDWPAASASVNDVAAGTRLLSHSRLDVTPSGMRLVQPLPAGFGQLVYHLPYRMLGTALAAELAVIAGAMLLLTGAIGLAARYWSRHLLRRTHAEASRALESELMNQVLVNATPIGLCIVRQHDYAVLTSNPLAGVLLQWQPHGHLPDAVAEAFKKQPCGGSSGQASISSFTVAAPPRVPADEPSGHGDATQHFLQITYAPARYRDEAVLFCAVQDCTAQQALQEQLRSAQQATEAMMRARSTFFAAMSHEIRTPLNALLGNLELLARGSGLAAHAPRLRALDSAAEALRRIVNDVLDFSKIDAGKLRLVNAPFRPVEALESVALTHAPMVAGRPIRFHLQLSPSLDAEVTGDRMRLVQVFNNLLSNAFKFTASGRITLSGELRQDHHGTQRLVCRVSDSGIGMPPSLAARVFQPFVQGDAATASRYGGTGLGLSICARLCELMGGSISVDSVPDVGSAFTVSVPLPAAAGTPLPPVPPAAAQCGDVVVLCQHMRTGEALAAWLATAGWRADVLASQAAALASFQVKVPRVIVATEEYPLAALAGLRDAAKVPVVWVTQEGPHRPCQCAPGMHEVTAYSHRALLDCVAQAAEGPAPALATADGSAPAAQALPASAEAPLTILVAEDNALNQTLIAEQLQALGCHPIVAGNGRQALAELESTHIDAVLTDIHMPVMDGHALLRAVRAQHPDMPVLAFSALTGSEPCADWRLRGFSGFIAKPASLQDLQACLHGLPGRRHAAAPRTNDEPAAASQAETADRRRYEAMLRRQLQQDLPALAHIIAQQDLPALRHWVHAAAGAFMIVRRQPIVGACLALEALCDGAQAWTPAAAAAAEALHERLRGYAQAAAAE
ncbi:sensor protein rcsC [Cupriavidus sp. GA3-3]|uniref:ATP-binding protein n=1 Tax=Cupriavidus sp. GA3-3 TaxID=1229514 RepID=UPI000330EC5C|nr:ATP-binding protein [Cupriavidus sp. GA3-3]EON18028.1 sensor protein rcsC [Cupriavidus sp. GA3-3]